MHKTYAFLKAALGEVGFTAPPEVYFEQRPILLKPFKSERMVKYLGIMQLEVQQWLDAPPAFLMQKGKLSMQKYLALSATVAAAMVLANRQLLRRQANASHAGHVSSTAEAYRRARTHILILGAGFGGLATALRLEDQMKLSDDTSILVVDRNNDLLFTPLLWTVSNGRTNPSNVVVPIRDFQRGRRFHVLHAKVENIDLEHREVQTSEGQLPYDMLVIALGSHTSMPDLPGLHTYALPFHTPANALELRNHLINAIEAAHYSTNVEERRAWLTFVIGGAGDTGIELAAIIRDYLISGLFKAYPWLTHEPPRVIVVGRSERVLPTGKPQTSRIVHRLFEKEGIEVLTGRSIIGVTKNSVETDMEVIPARTLFWAAGTTAPEIVQRMPVEHAHNGAIIVNQFLHIPEYPDVFVIGDNAWAYDATGAPIPATAQAAGLQGKYVGNVIAARYIKQPIKPYRYSTLGHLALLAHQKGVAEIGPFIINGSIAWILWHLVYLIRIPSWNKRIRLVIDWLQSSLLGRETGQLCLGNDLSYTDTDNA